MALLALYCLLLSVASSRCKINVESLENATEVLGRKFREIRNQVLGVDVLAAEYQRAGFTFSTLDPITVLSNTFPKEKISGVLDLFLNLNGSDLLNSSGGQTLDANGSEMAPANCCDVPTARPSSCCYGCSSLSPADLTLVSNISSSFATAFPSLSTNLMGLKLQYGHSNGALLSFPTSQRLSECTREDARLQPWYVDSLRKRAREVVLLVDVLNSIKEEEGKTQALRDAAIAVLESLTPQDSVQAVVFAEEVSAGSVLLNRGLVPICPSHVGMLTDFILTVQPPNKPGAVGAYDNAFKTAFSLFSNSESDKIILFFTSVGNFFTPFGVPPNRLLSNVSSLNMGRGNDIVISAYIVLRNRDLRSVVRDFLVPLVNQSNGKIVDLDDNIESRVGDYYSQFETTDNRVSVNQEIEYNGELSLAITVLLLNNTSLVGVLHATLPWKQLFSHIAMEIDRRSHSYIFVVSEGGRVLYHPLLPGNFQSDVSIGTIEDPELDGIFNNTTEISLTVKKPLLSQVAVREVEGNSFISHNISVTYTCRSLQIPDTVLFVCLAVADMDRTAARLTSVQLASLYSSDSDRKPLYHSTQISEKEHVFISAQYQQKFTSPSLPSAATTLQEITDYIEGQGMSDPLWAETGVASEVAVTSVVTETWLSGGNQVDDYITRRHLATPSGVYLTYPFASFFADFVPRYTEWYVLAAAHPNLLTLTPPRLDILKEGGHVVSAAFALTSPSSQGESPTASVDGQTLAVVAADMTLTSLRKILQDTFPECSFSSSSSSSNPHCFLLDDQGNLLFHNDFLDSDFQSHLREPIFFANATSMLTNHNAFQYILWKILESGLAAKGRCTDYLDEDIQQRLFFSLDLISNYTYTGSSAFNDYAIRRIPGTNAYLGAVHQKRRSDLLCICTHSCQTCRLQSTGCECPCSCPETCSPSSILSFQACPPAKFGSSNLGINSYKLPQADGNDLPFCSHLECACYANSTACEAARDCHWCSNFCRHTSEFSVSEQCKGTVSCSAHSSSSPRCSLLLTTKDNDNTATIVGAVIGALLGVILIALFVAFLIWHQFCRKVGEEEQKEDNAFDFSKTKLSAKNPGYGEVEKKGNLDGDAGTGGGDGDVDIAPDKSKEAEDTTF